MCQVEWFHQVIPYLTLSATRVLATLLATSYRGVSAGGSPVLLSRVSLPSLHQASNLPRRSVQRGLAELAGIHLLKLHRSFSPSGATVYEIPLVISGSLFKELRRQRGGDILSPPRPPNERRQNVTPLNNPRGGGVDPRGSQARFSISTTETGVNGGETAVAGDNLSPLAQLLAQLLALGFHGAEEFIAQHSAERIQVALDALGRTNPGEIRKPSAFIRHIVELPGPIESGADDYVENLRQQQREKALRGTTCPHEPAKGVYCAARRALSCEDPESCALYQRLAASFSQGR